MKKRINLLIIFVVAIILVCSFSLMSCQSKGSDNNLDQGDYYAGSSKNSSSSGADYYVVPAGRKVIYTAYASVYTDDSAKTVEQIKGKLNADEWIESESINSTSGNIVFRIKSTRLQEFLGQLAEFGKVGDYSVRSQDVTTAYSDIEAEIAKNEAYRTKVMDLIPQATTLEEILKLEETLSDIESELATLNKKKTSYDSDIDYSTVTVYINQNYYEEDPTFKEQTKTAITDSWLSIGIFFKYLFLGFIYAFPYLLAAGIIAFVVVICVRKKKGLPLFKCTKKQSKVEETKKEEIEEKKEIKE